ncbi:MAG: glycosyltransferase [Clostridia bacterium]|nr:glycosyltransferase [Clostridia bacterium]
MKKITILMLHLQHGGIEKQTITLANQLAKRYEVEIISTYSMLYAPAYPVDERVKITYLINGRPNREEIKAAIRSKKLIELIKQGIKAVKILYLKKTLMVNAIKKLDCDCVLSTRIEFAEMLSAHAPKGVVTMTQEHLHDDSEEYVARAQEAFKGLDYLLVLCDGSRQNFFRWLKGNDHIKIVQIPNILEAVPEDTAALSGNNLVAVGRLHPVKNFGTLIEVFASVKKKIPDATLTIVGGGEEQGALEAKVKELGLEDSVKITGMVSADEVKQYMLDADLYVMTSHTECFPMVLLEASSVGLPLVAFDVPVGPKAIIENGENGILVPYEDREKMSQEIIGILENSSYKQKLADGAKRMSYRYLADEIMPLWFKLFDGKGDDFK